MRVRTKKHSTENNDMARFIGPLDKIAEIIIVVKIFFMIFTSYFLLIESNKEIFL